MNTGVGTFGFAPKKGWIGLFDLEEVERALMGEESMTMGKSGVFPSCFDEDLDLALKTENTGADAVETRVVSSSIMTTEGLRPRIACASWSGTHIMTGSSVYLTALSPRGNESLGNSDAPTMILSVTRGKSTFVGGSGVLSTDITFGVGGTSSILTRDTVFSNTSS